MMTDTSRGGGLATKIRSGIGHKLEGWVPLAIFCHNWGGG